MIQIECVCLSLINEIETTICEWRTSVKRIAHIVFAMMFFLCFVLCEDDALADGTNKIGDENGFLLSHSEIISAYNNLMDGKDPNYAESDELLKIEISDYGKSFFTSNIKVKKSTNQFGVYFLLNDELINDYSIEQAPDRLLIWTGARKELIEQDESREMLPQIFSAFIYLCNNSIKDSSDAKKRADDIMATCAETHDWVQIDGFDYYCATFPIKEKDGHYSIRLVISIKNHDVTTSFEPM